jgi:DNA-binding response OmpR family regulator
VLIMEDVLDTARLFEMLLAANGFDVRVALDDGAARAVAPEFRPDVMLVDAEFGGVDGFALAAELRAQLRGPCKLIALTGWTTPVFHEHARELGFSDYLFKPVRGPDLIACIEAVLEARRTH